MTIRAWWLFIGLVLGALAGMLDAQPKVVTLAIGRVTATEQEAQECYIYFGYAFVIFPSAGEFCPIARELVGKTGTLLFVPDD